MGSRPAGLIATRQQTGCAIDSLNLAAHSPKTDLETRLLKVVAGRHRAKSET